MEKIPPQNIEAEQSLLGALLIDKDAIIKIADKVEAPDFYKNIHGMIFESMLDLYSAREPIDLLSLANKLEEKKHLETVGGRTYLASLASIVPSAAHIVHYAEITRKKSTLRRLISASAEISELGFHEEDEVDKVLDEAEKKLFLVSQKYLKQAFVPVKSILSDTFDRIDELHREKGKIRGVPTGFKVLDSHLGGLQKSDLVIVAARPSMGKTSLALDFARNAAVKSKVPVGIFSLEMSKEQLVDRLLCAESQLDLWKLRTGNLSDREGVDDFPRIGHAMGVLSEAPLFIDDSAAASIMAIRTKARRLQMEHGIGLIVIDYLQLMEGRGNAESRTQEISEITRSLKGIARELSIPIVALSQLNRSVEMRTPPIPKLADLRESGSIEQDADVVMFIYREDYYKKDNQKTNIADILIEKHRNGPTGKVQLYWNDRAACFGNLEKSMNNAFIPPEMLMQASEVQLS